jgi:hypothetical protein
VGNFDEHPRGISVSAIKSTRIRPGLGTWACFTLHHTDTGLLVCVHTRLADALHALADL